MTAVLQDGRTILSAASHTSRHAPSLPSQALQWAPNKGVGKGNRCDSQRCAYSHGVRPQHPWWPLLLAVPHMGGGGCYGSRPGLAGAAARCVLRRRAHACTPVSHMHPASASFAPSCCASLPCLAHSNALQARVYGCRLRGISRPSDGRQILPQSRSKMAVLKAATSSVPCRQLVTADAADGGSHI